MSIGEIERWFRVSQWYTQEAAWLDARRYDLWLELLSPEIQYRVPARSYVEQERAADFSTWSIERELSAPGYLDLVFDDHAGLTARIARLQTSMAWAETPPSATRRLVSNVDVKSSSDGVLYVNSNLLLHKSRADERVLYAAQRRDVLTGPVDDMKLAERTVILDDVVLPSHNLSVIF